MFFAPEQWVIQHAVWGALGAGTHSGVVRDALHRLADAAADISIEMAHDKGRYCPTDESGSWRELSGYCRGAAYAIAGMAEVRNHPATLYSRRRRERGESAR